MAENLGAWGGGTDAVPIPGSSRPTDAHPGRMWVPAVEPQFVLLGYAGCGLEPQCAAYRAEGRKELQIDIHDSSVETFPPKPSPQPRARSVDSPRDAVSLLVLGGSIDYR